MDLLFRPFAIAVVKNETFAECGCEPNLTENTLYLFIRDAGYLIYNTT